MNPSTIDFYNKNAAQYVEQTQNVLNSEEIGRFCSKLKPKAHILDIGAGSGRDSRYFLDNGFEVTAIDACAQIAQIASKKISQHVIVMDMLDIAWDNKFDAAWASASLLHLTKKEFNTVLDKIICALKPDATLYFSLKSGTGEGFDSKNRFFSYYSITEINSILKTKGFQDIQITTSGDSMGRDDTLWLSISTTVTPEQKNTIKTNITPITQKIKF